MTKAPKEKWMIFSLNFADNVKYRQSDMANNSILRYEKFVEYLRGFNPYDIKGLIDEINRYQTIFLNTTTGMWKLIPIGEYSDEQDNSFETLSKFNPNTSKEDNVKETPKDLFQKKFQKIFKKGF